MTFIILLRQAAFRWYERDGSLLAASLSYYTPFALTPLILISITVLSLVYGNDFVVRMLLHWGGMLGPELVELLGVATRNLERTTEQFSIPLVGTLFFMSMVIVAFNTLTSGFNTLWEIPHSGITGWLKKCWRSTVFIIALQAYLIFVMGLDGMFLDSELTLVPQAANLVSLIATTLLFYLMYRLLPTVRPTRWGSFFGAFIAGLLLLVSKVAVAYYLTITPIPKLFDTAGLIFVLLIWIYVVAAIVYFGAALVYEYDKIHSNT